MEEEVYILIAKSLNGEATAAEQQELDSWLKKDAANMDIYREMQGLWQEADTLVQQPEFNASAAWEKVAARTTENNTVTEKKTIPLRRWHRISLAAAAILLILLVINSLSGPDMKSVIAGNTMVMVELPDQSKVRLQAGSTLEYPEEFSNDERRVSLEGEAFFEVARNERQPFIIDAQTIDVQVLGTSFYVISNTMGASVAVTTGKVRMTEKNRGSKVELTPGEKGLYNGERISVVADTNAVFYREGVLNFSGVTLGDALQVLSNVKNAPIETSPGIDSSVRQQIIEISFRNQTLEEMLNELCLITSTRWEKNRDRYLIFAK
jgi:ferric-dicitrate binding protein FerR (iron transport regulator)